MADQFLIRRRLRARYWLAQVTERAAWLEALCNPNEDTITAHDVAWLTLRLARAEYLASGEIVEVFKTDTLRCPPPSSR